MYKLYKFTVPGLHFAVGGPVDVNKINNIAITAELKDCCTVTMYET